MSVGLILGQLPIVAVPALSVELAILWEMDASQIGWLGGIYFSGYAVALPFLTGAANRMDGRIVYAVAALISTVASFSVALFADGFWWALVLRFVAGIGFAGIHIVGMKMLADRLVGEPQTRASAYYTGAFAVGSGCSFMVAGLLSRSLGWEAAFVAAGIGSLLSLPTLLLIGPPLDGNETRSGRLFPDFGEALRDAEIVRYVIAYAGNLWEVFAIRVWFVPFLAYNAALNENTSLDWNPTTVAALSVVIAVPLNLAIAELGICSYRGTVEPRHCGAGGQMGSQACHFRGIACVCLGLRHAWLAGVRTLCFRTCHAVDSQRYQLWRCRRHRWRRCGGFNGSNTGGGSGPVWHGRFHIWFSWPSCRRVGGRPGWWPRRARGLALGIRGHGIGFGRFRLGDGMEA